MLRKFGVPDCFILGRVRKFLAASSTTMESLPLKELDFGLQKPTGPSSGVVASIVLIIIALSSLSFFFFTQLTFQIVYKYSNICNLPLKMGNSFGAEVVHHPLGCKQKSQYYYGNNS